MKDLRIAVLAKPIRHHSRPIDVQGRMCWWMKDCASLSLICAIIVEKICAVAEWNAITTLVSNACAYLGFLIQQHRLNISASAPIVFAVEYQIVRWIIVATLVASPNLKKFNS